MCFRSDSAACLYLFKLTLQYVGNASRAHSSSCLVGKVKCLIYGMYKIFSWALFLRDFRNVHSLFHI